MQTHYRREMSISHHEFLRLLPAALGDVGHVVNGTEISVDDHGKKMQIRLSPEGERAVGSMQLPLTYVDMDFSDYSQAEVDSFFERFDEYYQREGGG